MTEPSASHDSAELTLTSSEVCQIARVTPRQLQWWDERQIVCPTRSGHKRIYRCQDVIAVLVATELRRKGLSLQKVRKVLRFVQREMDPPQHSALVDRQDSYLVTDGKSVYLESDRKSIIERLKGARRPMLLVCVSDQAARLSDLEKKLRVQRTARSRGRGARGTDSQLTLF